MSKYYLNKCIKEMENCPHGCDIYNDIKTHSGKLVDKSHIYLRSKPSDSISLLYLL